MKKKVKITSVEVAIWHIKVSRAFTPESPVAKKTRENSLISQMLWHAALTRKSNMVGIVISNVTSNPFYPEVLDLLSRKFQENGQKVMARSEP